MLCKDSVGNFEGAMSCATRVAGTIKLLRHGIADWANEGHAMIKVISFFASWHCGVWCARLSRLFGDTQLYSFSLFAPFDRLNFSACTLSPS
jgi:hypothetical protein